VVGALQLPPLTAAARPVLLMTGASSTPVWLAAMAGMRGWQYPGCLQAPWKANHPRAACSGGGGLRQWWHV
jgi:hypothetical protein